MNESVRKQAEQALKGLPQSISQDVRQNTYRNWLLAFYLQIVSDCVDAGTLPEPFTFVPDVAVESVEEGSQRTRARELVQKVCAKDVGDIEEAIRVKHAEFEASLPSWMEDTSEDVWKEKLREQYYDIIADILTKKRVLDNTKKDTGRPKEKRSAEKTGSPNPMAYSPAKGIRSSSSSIELEFLEASEFHLREHCGGDEFAFEGFLLYSPDTVKTLDVLDFKTGAKKKESLFVFLVADASAPLLCKFWNKAAVTTSAKLKQWRTKNPDEETIRVKITCVAVQKEKMKSSTLLTPRKVLTSTDRTTFECVQTFQRSHDASVERGIHEDIFATCFECMRSATLPFEISLAGKICDLGTERKSKDGTSMLEFTLQDQTGLYVQCMAHGRHAESGILKQDQEIIAYFGSVKRGLETTDPGRIWFYSESHIVRRDEEYVRCDMCEEIVLT